MKNLYPWIAVAGLCGLSATAHARAINIETYCWDNDPDIASNGQRMFECEVDNRVLANVTAFPQPQFDPHDPNAWPTKVTNWVGTSRLLGSDHERCVQAVRKSAYPGVSKDDIHTVCAVTVDWIAPLGVASGSDMLFNIENGLKDGKDMQNGWSGVIADVKSMSCGCYIIDNTSGGPL
jgi:hypothetical protein